jgi:putative Mg2+ transporter-C (MgtC) family protein
MLHLNMGSVAPQLVFTAQILLAVALGALVGWQREKSGKAAGGRTFGIVSAGSCLFTILSLHAFDGADPARIAAQVVVGIGFLGAGAILHRETNIYGLTTAAGLWISAAIGMAVGVGFYLVAILSAFIMLGVLMVNEKSIFKSDHDDDRIDG